MSITNLISPSGTVSVQDDLWHIATSNNYLQPDFKYVFDVFDLSGNQLVRTKVYPEPSNGLGYFDASQVVRNEMKLNWFTPNSTYGQQTYNSYLIEPDYSGQIAIKYFIQVGEDYSGITTLNMASGSVVAYNKLPTLFERRKNIAQINDNLDWGTNRPLIANVGSRNEKLLVPFKGYGEDLQMNVKAYDFANNLIFNTSSPDVWAGQNAGIDPISKRKFVQMDIGIKACEDTVDDVFYSSNLNYYDVSFERRSYIRKFRVYKVCDKYEVINLYFINAYGCFDTARFSLVSKLSLDIERKNFQKRDYRFVGNSVQFKNINDVYEETKINYGNKINWKYKLTMDFPSDDEYQWLYELIVSPQIYARIGDGYYPVSIVQTNYEYSKYEFNKLKAFEIDIELNQIRYGYRR